MRVNRLQYADYEGEISHQTLPILDALVSCPKLERLVLFEEEGPNLPWGDEKLQDILFKFVSSMKHLVAFCFISASEYELGSVYHSKPAGVLVSRRSGSSKSQRPYCASNPLRRDRLSHQLFRGFSQFVIVYLHVFIISFIWGEYCRSFD